MLFSVLCSLTDYIVHLRTENFTALASEVSVMGDGRMEYSFDEADGLREDSLYYYYISVSSGIGVLETEPRECCEYNWASELQASQPHTSYSDKSQNCWLFLCVANPFLPELHRLAGKGSGQI